MPLTLGKCVFRKAGTPGYRRPPYTPNPWLRSLAMASLRRSSGAGTDEFRPRLGWRGGAQWQAGGRAAGCHEVQSPITPKRESQIPKAWACRSAWGCTGAYFYRVYLRYGLPSMFFETDASAHATLHARMCAARCARRMSRGRLHPPIPLPAEAPGQEGEVRSRPQLSGDGPHRVPLHPGALCEAPGEPPSGAPPPGARPRRPKKQTPDVSW